MLQPDVTVDNNSRADDNDRKAGLLRLSLKKNMFLTDDEVYNSVVRVMKSRDPVAARRRRVYVM